MIDFALQIVIENVIFLICSFFAAGIATVAGFGSSTLLLPVAMLFMDVKTAIFIVACFHLFSNVIKTNIFWKEIDLRIFLQFGIPSIIFAIIGAKLVAYFPIEVLKKIVALFLIGFAIYSLIKPRIIIQPNWFTAVAGGSFSGFMSGLIGLGGAIRSTFLVSFNLPKEMYVGTAAVIAMVVDISRIPTYIMGNLVTNSSYYQLLPFLLVTAFLGTQVGKKYLKKITPNTFRRIVFISILLIGIKFLF